MANLRSLMIIAQAKLSFNSTAISTKRASFLLASTSNILKSSPGSTCCYLLEVSDTSSSYESPLSRSNFFWPFFFFLLWLDHFFRNSWPWRSSSEGCRRETFGLCVLNDTLHAEIINLRHLLVLSLDSISETQSSPCHTQSYPALPYRMDWHVTSDVPLKKRIQYLSVMSMSTPKKQYATDNLRSSARSMTLPTGAYVQDSDCRWMVWPKKKGSLKVKWWRPSVMELKISSTGDLQRFRHCRSQHYSRCRHRLSYVTEWQAESQTYQSVGRPVRDHALDG